MRLSFLPLILLAIPMAEIAVFILVGQYIGLWPTLALVILTAVAGSMLLRVQGFGALRQLNEGSQRGVPPGKQLANGVMILLAGLLLVTPGFITDTIGLLLFIPPFRSWMWDRLKSRITVVSSAGGFSQTWSSEPRPHGARGTPGVVDLDESDYSSSASKPSPWNGKEIDIDKD